MHSSTPKKILAVVCSFLLSLLTFLLLVAICTKMTFFDKGFYLSNIAKTHYYEKVTSDLMEDFTSLGIPGGIPDEVFKNTISQDDVQTEIMACIDTSFSGKTYQIRSNAVKQKLYSAFLDYAKQQHKREATDQEQQALQELASECEKVYIQNVRFPFIQQISGAKALYDRFFIPAAIILGVLCVLLGVAIWFTQRWRHRAIRLYVYAGVGCSLTGILFPLYMLIWAPYKQLNIQPPALHGLLTSMASQYLISLLVVFVVVGLLCTVLAPIYRKLKNKVL